jgi:polysaccharide biosynthesis protein PslJ
VNGSTSVVESRPILAGAATVLLLAAVAAAAVSGTYPAVVCALALVVTVLLVHGTYVRWETLTGLILLVIFLIPIRRYSLPSSLPIVLEPYRLVVAGVMALWLAALFVDRRVRVRRSGFDGPLMVIVCAVFISLLANPKRVAEVGSHATKNLMFFISFLLVFYLVVSTVTRMRNVDRLIKLMVASGTAVALFSLIEFRTGYNVFDHFSGLPGLQREKLPTELGDPTGFSRGGRVRVYASAQHPIALGAVLTLLVPLAVYLARTSRRWYWWLAAAVSVLGVCATVSRTSIVMLLVVVAVYLWLRPRETRRLWPALIPLVVLIHVATPGTLGSIKDAFFPRGGLVAQEAQNQVGSGRLATLWPALRHEVYPNLLFGEGFGTRVVTGDSDATPNAPILDDQWLGTLAETGIVGACAWLWLLVAYVRRLGAAAKRAGDDDRVWLYTGLAASVAAFSVAMALFDSFSFIQVTFVLYFLLALGAAILRFEREPAAARSRRWFLYRTNTASFPQPSGQVP